jgi:hypothetical protein
MPPKPGTGNTGVSQTRVKENPSEKPEKDK